jgi:serine/threonine protein kinase
MDDLVAERFRILRRLSKSYSCELFECFHPVHGRAVFVKAYRPDVGPPIESQICQAFTGRPGFVTLLDSGMIDCYPFIAFDPLGPPLEVLHRMSQNKFSLPTVCRIADQLLARVAQLHDNDFVHRGLNPSSVFLGTGKNRSTLYLLDFTLAKSFVATDPRRHIPLRTGGRFAHNAEYSSVRAFMGYEQSRRDDVESVIYMLISFLRGDLPWTVGGGDDQQRIRVKATATIQTMCAGLPQEFGQVLREVRLLKFEERPDYDAYRQTFARIAADEPFDWEKSGLLASLERDAGPSRTRTLSFQGKLPPLERRPACGSARRSGGERRATAQLVEPAVRPNQMRYKALVPRHSVLSGGQRR